MFPNKTYTSRQQKGCTKCLESLITWNRPSTYTQIPVRTRRPSREKKDSSYSFSSLDRALFSSLFFFVAPAPLADNNCLLPQSSSSRNVFFVRKKAYVDIVSNCNVYRMYFVENLYSKSMCLKQACWTELNLNGVHPVFPFIWTLNAERCPNFERERWTSNFKRKNAFTCTKNVCFCKKNGRGGN